MFVLTDDGCRLNVASGAPGRLPIVLSNSLGTDLSLWDAQVDAFARHNSVWRYDTRGHGKSDAPAGDYSIDRLGRDLLSVIDRTSAARVDLCGVSIGGLTALWVAINAPRRVRRVVLANTAARIGDTALWTERSCLVRAKGLSVIADASLGRWFTADFCQRHPDVSAHFRAVIARTAVDGYIGCCAALRDADLRDDAKQVKCRTLVVTGRCDVATPPALGRSLADTIPGARLIELEAAHLSNVERPEEFTAAVSGFVCEEQHG
jgi:3-oxoadipate enol-lactonase